MLISVQNGKYLDLLKIKMFKLHVLLVLLYGYGTWTLDIGKLIPYATSAFVES